MLSRLVPCSKLAVVILAVWCPSASAQWSGYSYDKAVDREVPRMLTLDAVIAWLQSDLERRVTDLDEREVGTLAKLLVGADEMQEPRARSALRVTRSLLAGHGRDLSAEETTEFERVAFGRVAAPSFVDRWDTRYPDVDWSQAELLARDLRDEAEARSARAVFYLRHWNVGAEPVRDALLGWVIASAERRAAWEELVAIDGVRRRIMGVPVVAHAGGTPRGEATSAGWVSVLPWWGPCDHTPVARLLAAQAPVPEVLEALGLGDGDTLRGRFLALARHMGATAVPVHVIEEGAEAWSVKRQRSAMATYVVQRNIEARMTAGPSTPAPAELTWIAEPDVRGWSMLLDIARAYRDIEEAMQRLDGPVRSGSRFVPLAEICLELARGERRRPDADKRLSALTAAPRDRLTGSPRSQTYLSEQFAFWISGTEGLLVDVDTPAGRRRAFAMVRTLQRRELPDGEWHAWP